MAFTGIQAKKEKNISPFGGVFGVRSEAEGKRAGLAEPAELADAAERKFRCGRLRGDVWSRNKRETRNGIAADTGPAGWRRAAAGRDAGFSTTSLRMI